MNISSKLYRLLVDWISCVERVPGESDMEWVARALEMRVDHNIECIEVDKKDFEEEIKRQGMELLKRLEKYSNEKKAN